MSRSYRTKFPATHTLTTQYRIDQGLGDLGSDTKRRVPCQGGCGRRFLKLKSARWHYCDQCEQVAEAVDAAANLNGCSYRDQLLSYVESKYQEVPAGRDPDQLNGSFWCLYFTDSELFALMMDFADLRRDV